MEYFIHNEIYEKRKKIYEKEEKSSRKKPHEERPFWIFYVTLVLIRKFSALTVSIDVYYYGYIEYLKYEATVLMSKMAKTKNCASSFDRWLLSEVMIRVDVSLGAL